MIARSKARVRLSSLVPGICGRVPAPRVSRLHAGRLSFHGDDFVRHALLPMRALVSTNEPTSGRVVRWVWFTSNATCCSAPASTSRADAILTARARSALRFAVSQSPERRCESAPARGSAAALSSWPTWERTASSAQDRWSPRQSRTMSSSPACPRGSSDTARILKHQPCSAAASSLSSTGTVRSPVRRSRTKRRSAPHPVVCTRSVRSSRTTGC